MLADEPGVAVKYHAFLTRERHPRSGALLVRSDKPVVFEVDPGAAAECSQQSDGSVGVFDGTEAASSWAPVEGVDGIVVTEPVSFVGNGSPVLRRMNPAGGTPGVPTVLVEADDIGDRYLA